MEGEITRIMVEHQGRSHVVHCFGNQLSLRHCSAILSGKTYPASPLVGQVRTVVDIGANVGASAVFFSLLYPGATVFAFEPAAAPFRLLALNAQERPAIRPHPVGLFNRDGTSRLHAGLVDSMTASLAAGSETSEGTEEIRLRDARSCMEELGVGAIDVLKIDTEGCERHVLASLGELATAAQAIYLEFHSERDRVELDRLLGPTHALVSGQVIGPHRGDLCYVARRLFPAGAYERDAVDIPFD